MSGYFATVYGPTVLVDGRPRRGKTTVVFKDGLSERRIKKTALPRLQALYEEVGRSQRLTLGNLEVRWIREAPRV